MLLVTLQNCCRPKIQWLGQSPIALMFTGVGMNGGSGGARNLTNGLTLNLPKCLSAAWFLPQNVVESKCENERQ